MFPDLICFCKSLHDRLSSELEPHGIFRGQGRILHALRHSGAMAQVDIARHLMLRRATVTRMLQRMERHGLIERFRDPADERIIRVRLTEAGEKAEAVMLEIRRDIELTVSRTLTEQEQLVFRDCLNRLMKAFQSGTRTAVDKNGLSCRSSNE